MTNPMIKIHNVETGEVIEREMTEAEIAQKTQDEEIAAQRDAAASARAAEKTALLEQLGITAEQAKLLLS
jgi:hypothetical protein